MTREEIEDARDVVREVLRIEQEIASLNPLPAGSWFTKKKESGSGRSRQERLFWKKERLLQQHRKLMAKANAFSESIDKVQEDNEEIGRIIYWRVWHPRMTWKSIDRIIYGKNTKTGSCSRAALFRWLDGKEMPGLYDD